jgi:hypothetical protein
MFINHLKLNFSADKPPQAPVAYQEFLMAAETSREYFYDLYFDQGGGLGDFRRS